MRIRLTAVISAFFLLGLCMVSQAQVQLSPEEVELILQQYQDQQIEIDSEMLDILLSQELVIEQPDDIFTLLLERIINPPCNMRLHCVQEINSKDSNPSQSNLTEESSCYNMTDYTITISRNCSRIDKILRNENDPDDTIRIIESCDGSRIQSMEYKNNSPPECKQTLVKNSFSEVYENLYGWPLDITNPALRSKLKFQILPHEDSDIIVLESTNISRNRIYVDKNKEYNIVKWQVLRDDDSIETEINCEYALSDQGVWYPAGFQKTNYPVGQQNGSYIEKNVKVVKAEFNREISEDEIFLKYPVGTKVWDEVLNDWFIAGVPNEKFKLKSPQFTFVRIIYLDDDTSYEYWSTDHPYSDFNLTRRFHEMTGLKTNDNIVAMQLTDPDLKKYPFIYIVEGGNMLLEPGEVKALRDYLLGGGFLLMDDFWGQIEWGNIYAQIKMVFPEYEPVELPPNHEIFNCFYEITEPPQIPAFTFITNTDGTLSDVTTESPDAPQAVVYGIYDDNNRLMVVICRDTDLGDGWEREGANTEFLTEFSEKKAFPLGINILLYALTH